MEPAGSAYLYALVSVSVTLWDFPRFCSFSGRPEARPRAGMRRTKRGLVQNPPVLYRDQGRQRYSKLPQIGSVERRGIRIPFGLSNAALSDLGGVGVF